MHRYANAIRVSMVAMALAALAGSAFAQNAAANLPPGVLKNPNYHLGFDRPEAWGLKYFASTTMLSGLQPPENSTEARHVGSVTLSLELGWVPQLDAGQERIGFNGRAPQDL